MKTASDHLWCNSARTPAPVADLLMIPFMFSERGTYQRKRIHLSVAGDQWYMDASQYFSWVLLTCFAQRPNKANTCTTSKGGLASPPGILHLLGESTTLWSHWLQRRSDKRGFELNRFPWWGIFKTAVLALGDANFCFVYRRIISKNTSSSVAMDNICPKKCNTGIKSIQLVLNC